MNGLGRRVHLNYNAFRNNKLIDQENVWYYSCMFGNLDYRIWFFVMILRHKLAF